MNIPGTAAAVTGTHKNELMLFYTLLELTLIVLAGRIGGAQFGFESSGVGDHRLHDEYPGLDGTIVLNVGLDLGVISPKVFTMLVIMAIFSTVITTPALRYYMTRAGLTPSGIGIDGTDRDARRRARS